MFRKIVWQGFSIAKGVDRTYVRNYFFGNSSDRTGSKIFKHPFKQELQTMGCSDSKYVISSRMANTGQSDEYVEDTVCKVTDLKENEPQVFSLDEGKVLVIKQNGKINAIGTKCTHYGAPLVSSAVGDGRVRCQWHGACFNIETGDIEDFPGLDSLPCYQVTIDDDNVRVRAKKSVLVANKRVKSMVKRNRTSTGKIVVIGGGPAAAECVEALRQEGYDGSITMVCKENVLPYDRVKCSKALDTEIKKLEFRDEDFYKSHDIDVLKGVEATAVNASTKTVSLSNSTTLSYDKLFIATGTKPRLLDVPGNDLKNVKVVRTYEDANYINGQLTPETEVVLLGSSFIAMEVANYCVKKAKKVTVVFQHELPFEPVLGARIGAAIMNLFKENGVNFVINSGIVKINGDSNGTLNSVELKDRSTLKADLLILGIGGILNTEFLKGSGIDVRTNGTIETDEFLQTNNPDVYVGGDIAFAPIWSHDDQKGSIGHIGLALYHGKVAALNMIGKKERVQNIPFFWSMLFGKSFRYAGFGKFDDIIYTGNVEEYKFAAFYLKDGVVVSIATCGMDPITSQYAEHVTQGNKLLKEHIQDNPLSWIKT